MWTSPRETIESLRLTLQRLEQTGARTSDPDGVAALKRILRKRIADLEMLDALRSQPLVPTASDEQFARHAGRSAPACGSGRAPKEAIDTTQRDKKL